MVQQQQALTRKKDVIVSWFGEWNEANGSAWQSAILGNATDPDGDIGDYTASAVAPGIVYAAWAQPGKAGNGAALSRIQVAAGRPLCDVAALPT